MTKLDKTALSTLILKMVGGTLDGKRLKVTTQKCFLTGGDNPNAGQCTIIRGPSGTQLRATTDVYVNGIPGTVHWLKEGDGIEIGQMRMVVSQLGYFPATNEKEAKVSEETSEQAKSTAVEAEVSGRPSSTPKTQSLQTAGDEESNEQGRPDSDQPVESTPESKETSTVSSGTTNSPSTDTPTVPPIQSSLSEKEKLANEARLERALHSLAGLGEGSTSAQTTENLVEQRLDALENELESHEKSYSEPMPNSNVSRRALAPTILATSDENYAATEGVEDAPEATASEVDTQSENEAVESNDSDEAFEPTAESARQALPPLLAPLSMLEADAARENEISQSTSESTSQETVESQSDSASAEEQAKLDEIMQRLGVGTGDKDASESADTSEDDQSPVSEQSTSLETSSALETTEPTAVVTEEEAVEEEAIEEEATEAEATEEEAIEEEATKEIAVEQVATKEEATEEVAESTDTAERQSESVADILARMKSEGKLDDFDAPTDDNTDSSTSEAAEPVPAPEPVAEPVSQSSEQQEPEPQQSDSPEGDVQDYMNQLFQRLRGDDAGEAAATAAAPAPAADKPKPAEAPKPETSSQPKPEAPKKPRPAVLEESEFIPKQRAPEAHTDIQALRQLANKQKTNAVSSCFEAKSKFEQAITSYVAGGALAATVAFGWIAKSIYDPAGILAVICFVIGLVALARYVSNLKKSKELALNEPNRSGR